jgi:ATP-dependent Clp protease protease subunit
MTMNRKLLQLLSDNARAEAPASIRMEATADAAHVYVYDVIDSYWGASAKALVDAFAAAGDKPVHLHINSPGGDVFEARAMVSAVRAHQQRGFSVTAHIDGLAASAATYLSLSAETVNIAEGGMFMVHNSWTLAWGNKTELRSTADLLDKIDTTIAADYQRKTLASAEQVTAWMDAETWFTADEAKAAGFVDAVITAPAPATSKAARWNLSAYANAPQIQAPPAEPTDDEITTRAANASRVNRSRLAALLTRT